MTFWIPSVCPKWIRRAALALPKISPPPLRPTLPPLPPPTLNKSRWVARCRPCSISVVSARMDLQSNGLPNQNQTNLQALAAKTTFWLIVACKRNIPPPPQLPLPPLPYQILLLNPPKIQKPYTKTDPSRTLNQPRSLPALWRDRVLKSATTRTAASQRRTIFAPLPLTRPPPSPCR